MHVFIYYYVYIKVKVTMNNNKDTEKFKNGKLSGYEKTVILIHDYFFILNTLLPL